MAVEESLELRQGRLRLGQKIETKLNENGVFTGSFGPCKELGRRSALHRKTQLAHPQARRDKGRRRKRSYRAGGRDRHSFN
jgi:hypothetical protein